MLRGGIRLDLIVFLLARSREPLTQQWTSQRHGVLPEPSPTYATGSSKQPLVITHHIVRASSVVPKYSGLAGSIVHKQVL